LRQHVAVSPLLTMTTFVRIWREVSALTGGETQFDSKVGLAVLAGGLAAGTSAGFAQSVFDALFTPSAVNIIRPSVVKMHAVAAGKNTNRLVGGTLAACGHLPPVSRAMIAGGMTDLAGGLITTIFNNYAAGRTPFAGYSASVPTTFIGGAAESACNVLAKRHIIDSRRARHGAPRGRLTLSEAAELGVYAGLGAGVVKLACAWHVAPGDAALRTIGGSSRYVARNVVGTVANYVAFECAASVFACLSAAKASPAVPVTLDKKRR
jgi:hypothetical protein